MKTTTEIKFVKVGNDLTCAAFQIVRYVVRTAYARSGNAHNPTIQHGYMIKYNGLVVSNATTQSKAKTFVIECMNAEGGPEAVLF